jgi:hypothetical protein
MTRVRVTTLTLLMLAALASQASAFTLTGTWTGTRKCQDLFEGGKDKFTDPVTFHITQVGNAIGIFADFGGGDTTNYTGLANFPALKPDKGEFAMIHCGTNDIVGDGATYDSIGRMQASTKATKVKAKIKGTTIFSDPGAAQPSLGTCKWSLTRTDTTDSVVATTCP